MVITADQTIQVEATRGIGTGLAFTQAYGIEEPRLILVHVASGYMLGKQWITTEEEARLFLENVSKLDRDRWNIDLATLKKRHMKNNAQISKTQAKFDNALENSLIDIFMYADDKNGELVSPSVDVESVDPESEANKNLVAEIFASYPEAVKVTLVKMPAATGIHELQHVYERAAVTTAA
jgi:hypothetical protein